MLINNWYVAALSSEVTRDKPLRRAHAGLRLRAVPGRGRQGGLPERRLLPSGRLAGAGAKSAAARGRLPLPRLGIRRRRRVHQHPGAGPGGPHPEAGPRRQLPDEGEVRLGLGLPGRPAGERAAEDPRPVPRVRRPAELAPHSLPVRGQGQLDALRGELPRHRAHQLRAPAVRQQAQSEARDPARSRRRSGARGSAA